MKRVAVVGSGISGLAVAHALASEAHVTLFEAAGQFGGHTHTVDIQLDGVTHGVDTGFLVFNERTYPNLVRLFAELDVETAPAEMSFSVQVPQEGLEWSGNGLNGVFAQRRNLLRPRFWHLLADIVRFNRLATGLATNLTENGATAEQAEPIGEFLNRHRFGAPFRDGYFLPMIGCIWSCPTDQMLQFPITTMIRFCHNHGLIQIANRPQWHTVRGGARNYVQRMLPRIADARLRTPVIGVKRLPPANLWLAMGKSVVFGLMIAVIGCHYGLRVKPNTESLGQGTTASVVTSITLVILVDALFAVVFKGVGI